MKPLDDRGAREAGQRSSGEPRPQSRLLIPLSVAAPALGVVALVLWIPRLRHSHSHSEPAAVAALPPGATKVDEMLFQARVAKSNNKADEAMALANKAIAAEPNNPRTYYLRGALFESAKQHEQAIADYNEVIRLEPKASQAYQNRGSEHFMLGKFTESVADFDKFLELKPDQKAQHWQRGIACYFAGNFEAGRKQFELHQTVNTNDVENAVWHFLCVARLAGVEKARAALISIKDDHRVPMMRVHDLFAGKATPEEVLAATKKDNPPADELGHRQFYADLYLGLYFEATGDAQRTREYIFKAVERAADNGFMGAVAQVHAELLRRGETKKNAQP